VKVALDTVPVCTTPTLSREASYCHVEAPLPPVHVAVYEVPDIVSAPSVGVPGPVVAEVVEHGPLSPPAFVAVTLYVCAEFVAPEESV